MTTTRDTESALVDALVRIRRAWARPDAPLTRGGPGRTPGPTMPLDHAWLTRRSAVETLAFWAHAAIDDNFATPADGARLDLGDVDAVALHLLHHARELTGWVFAPTLVDEVRGVASALEEITREVVPQTLETHGLGGWDELPVQLLDAPALLDALRDRLGVRLTPATLRKRAERGRLPSAVACRVVDRACLYDLTRTTLSLAARV